MRIRRGLRKHLDKGKNTLLNEAKKSALNSFYVVTKHGNVMGRGDAPCYWWLKDVRRNYKEINFKTNPVEYVVSYQRKPPKQYGVTKEVELAYLEYALHQSPYAGVLGEKYGSVADSRVFVGDAETPCNVMLGAFLMLRYPHEDCTARKSTIWYDFVKRGMNPDLAYVSSQFLVHEGKKKTIHLGNTCHSLLNLGCARGYLNVIAHNFINRNSIQETEPYKTSMKYDTIDNRWYDMGMENKVPNYYSIINKAFKEAGDVNKKNNNPFSQAREVSAKAYDDVLDSVKHYMEKAA